MQYAGSFAHSRQSTVVEAIDLMAGLLADQEGPAFSALKLHGTNFDKLRQKLPNAPTDPENTSKAKALPRSELLREVIYQAIEYTVALNRFDQVGSRELLVALLEQWERGATTLADCGTNFKALVDEFHQERQTEPISVPAEDLVPTRIDATETIDLARMVDANANRAREAFRVLEDVARFVLDDDQLCGTLKECRHSLKEALSFFPNHWLVAARDTEQDLGTWISTREEFARGNLDAVITANCKRAQEAVRTLEECSKVENANAARLLERLRYNLYTIEKRLTLAGQATRRLAGVHLYWLIDPQVSMHSVDWMIEQGVAGGVGLVQLRFKNADDRELLDTARNIRQWTRDQGILFIVNDRPDIARLCDADGVHLGQEDMTVKDARRILGPNGIIGVSTHELDQAKQAVIDGADYIGVGPVFTSQTKQFDQFAGLEYVSQVAQHIRLPAFCIGGIDEENCEKVVAAGGTRIAVSSALSRSDSPMQTARTFRGILDF